VVLRLRFAIKRTDATLARIIGLVKNAQAAQAPVKKLANKIAAWLIPVVFVFLTNLSPAFRPVDLGVEGFASPPLHALKPCPLGRGGAYSGLKAGVLNRVGIRINRPPTINHL
jgi:hypothetical protein